MHAKNNRVNKDFQIAYFLAGSCHTPDGAYALLKDLQEDREMALAQLEAQDLREQAKIAKAEENLKFGNKWDKLEAQADIAEIKNNQKFKDRNVEAAKKELEFINQCIEKLQPHRRFAHLPDPEAFEATQFDEWKFELMYRAENYLLTTGTIPTDHFATMRQHPAFATDILPHIDSIRNMIISKQDRQLLEGKLKLKDSRADIIKLLGTSETYK